MSTAPQGWQNPKTNWQAADIVHPSDFNRIEGNIQAIESGSRTLDPSQAPSGNQGTLRQMLDWFANRIRAITGTTNWYDTPPRTLADLDTHIKRNDNPHQVTAAQVGAPTQAAFDAHVADTNNPHNVRAQQVPYSSGVSGFTPSTVKAALDALAGVRIVEMGSNSNGTYVRWENGLQVVFGEATLGSISLGVHGSVYASPDLTVTLPAEFSTSVYAWHVNADSPLASVWAGLGSQAQTKMGSITFRLYGGVSFSNLNVTVSFFAIGRWK